MCQSENTNLNFLVQLTVSQEGLSVEQDSVQVSDQLTDGRNQESLTLGVLCGLCLVGEGLELLAGSVGSSSDSVNDGLELLHGDSVLVELLEVSIFSLEFTGSLLLGVAGLRLNRRGGIGSRSEGRSAVDWVSFKRSEGRGRDIARVDADSSGIGAGNGNSQNDENLGELHGEMCVGWGFER